MGRATRLFKGRCSLGFLVSPPDCRNTLPPLRFVHVREETFPVGTSPWRKCALENLIEVPAGPHFLSPPSPFPIVGSGLAQQGDVLREEPAGGFLVGFGLLCWPGVWFLCVFVGLVGCFFFVFGLGFWGQLLGWVVVYMTDFPSRDVCFPPSLI